MARMLGKTYDDRGVFDRARLEVVGERWSVLIVRDALFAGSTRYSDFERSLGIATNILEARLDGFVEAEIMRRQRYSARSPGGNAERRAVTTLAITAAPIEPPMVRMLAFMPLATPVCSGGTAATMRFDIAGEGQAEADAEDRREQVRSASRCVVRRARTAR